MSANERAQITSVFARVLRKCLPVEQKEQEADSAQERKRRGVAGKGSAEKGAGEGKKKETRREEEESSRDYQSSEKP